MRESTFTSKQCNQYFSQYTVNISFSRYKRQLPFIIKMSVRNNASASKDERMRNKTQKRTDHNFIGDIIFSYNYYKKSIKGNCDP